jgi:two-component system, NarL family, sensor histidine kinase UhpB
METIALTPASPPEILFKFISDNSGFGHFSYVSDGAQRVLGLSPRALCAQAQRFIDLIHEDERDSLIASLESSRVTLSQWVWDGKIRLPGGVDSRSISLRATPRKRSDGRVAWDGMMRYGFGHHRRKEAPQTERSARDQMALLAAYQEQAREDERLRLARELHDDVGGNLTGIKMQLSFMSARLSAEQRDIIAMDLDMLEQLVDRTIDSTRRLSSNLRPPTLDLGLIPALEWFLEDFGLRTGISVKFEAPDEDMDIPEPKKIAMFRVCQEALNNVFKHAEAQNATVRLTEQEEDSLRLEVIDDGKGFKHGTPKRADAFGLRGMFERASVLGGSLEIHSVANEGTRIILTIPLSSQS